MCDVLGPAMEDDEKCHQTGLFWLYLARFDPDSVQPLASCCRDFFEVIQLVAMGYQSVGCHVHGLPVNPDPFYFDAVHED